MGHLTTPLAIQANQSFAVDCLRLIYHHLGQLEDNIQRYIWEHNYPLGDFSGSEKNFFFELTKQLDIVKSMQQTVLGMYGQLYRSNLNIDGLWELVED